MKYQVRIFDQLFRKEIPFYPSMAGDVGHDLAAVISADDMSLLDAIVARLIRCKAPMLIIWPFSIRSIRSGLFLVMPQSVWCEIKSRSSAAKRMLAVIGGNIDSGYRGELFTMLHNIGLKPRIIKNGERYSQVIFHPAVRPEIKLISAVSFVRKAQEGRGADGFGSTGR